MNKLLSRLTFSLATLAATASAGAATTIYRNSFEGGPDSYVGASGGYVSPTLGYAALGFQTSMYIALGSPQRQVTFGFDYPASFGAQDLTLSLSLGMLGQWAGNGLDISLDGQSVYDATFDNATSPTTGPGLTTLSYGSDLGFYTLGDSSAYRLTLDLGAHAAQQSHTFTITASGLDGYADLAVDNILVTGTAAAATAVPEPANAALLALGLAALGVAVRRRAC